MKRFKVIGIMSGTSLDGVDLAYCIFEFNRKKWSVSIERATTIPYSSRMKRFISGLVHANAESFAEGHVRYGKFLGALVHSFIRRHRLDVDFVSSHGHTIFHQPKNHFTSQIGDGGAISAACEIPVVCDFRSADVALGGQGAPLVPIGDQLLFSQFEYCLNLGGIANISFNHKRKRLAFDICPVNLVLNQLAGELKKSYDAGGRIASKGKVNSSLLQQLNAIPYYRKAFPKSLGREDIEQYFISIIKKSRISTADKLRTFCEHIAIQIAAISYNPSSKILVTGGGAYNSFLISRIKVHCKAQLVLPDKLTIDFKEAMIFAFLGVLRWRNEVNCLGSVTGAWRDSSGGAIYNP